MIFRRAVVSLCAIATLCLLGACAVLAPPPDAASRAAAFDMLGRVLVGYDGKSFSSGVRWQHGAQSDELWLMTPTGQTLAYLFEDRNGAAITGTDQVKYHGASAEALAKQALGWEFPLARLQHWLRGNPVPNMAIDVVERDAGGRITRMTQDGWRIACEYYAATEQDGLPRRVDVTKSLQSIRVVIDRWRSEAAASDDSPGISITR